MRLKVGVLLFFMFSYCSCRPTKIIKEQGNIPIFDVHLHGSKEVNSQLADLEAAGVKTGAISTSWDLQSNYSSRTEMKILFGLMLPCPEGKVPYSLQSCFDNGKEWPDLQWVEQQIIDKKVDFIGEVLSQYYGISSSDSELFPYYALALKYDLPVGIHTGAAGPNHGSPNFKLEMGNPDLIRETVLKFPNLRIWMMHAGVPFLKENIAVMQEFKQIYTDISVINNPEIVPPKEFHTIIKELINAGLEDRIMFGSDNADINQSIASVKNLDFLSMEQKEKIFYINAQTFFKLL